MNDRLTWALTKTTDASSKVIHEHSSAPADSEARSDMGERVGSVCELWRYPVKSFRGEQLEEIQLDARGVTGDRLFALRDAKGKFGSGKTTRRFRLLRDLFDFSAETDGDAVVVHTPGGDRLRVGDAGLDALLSARYGEPLAVLPEEAVSHFDAGPVHVLTTSSLEWVATGYERTGGDARRYRPNIVLDTPRNAERVEEAWLGASLSIGSCVLEVTEKVERCVMPNLHQDGLPRAPGLLRFLVERNETMLGAEELNLTMCSPEVQVLTE